MIRTNLSTKPFYNARAVNVLLGAFTIVVLAVTAYNVVELVRLASSQRTLGAKADSAEREAVRLRAEARQTLQRVDAKELETVAKAAREANAIIDQRTFSWTQVFAYFEKTLPPDVRVTSVQQQANRQLVSISAEARNIADVDTFIEALGKTGAFRDVIPLSEVVMENDLINVRIEAAYVPEGTQTEARP